MHPQCVPAGVAPGEALGSQGQVSPEAVGGRPGAPHPGTTPCPVCLPGPRVSLLHAMPGVGGLARGILPPKPEPISPPGGPGQGASPTSSCPPGVLRGTQKPWRGEAGGGGGRGEYVSLSQHKQ